MQAKTKTLIQNEEVFFGPGTAAFFRMIQEKGSIRVATQTMDISYSKGWKIIKRAEKELGFPLFLREIGGADGGSSKLTKEGLDFLKRYVAMQNDIKKAADKIFSAYFPNG